MLRVHILSPKRTIYEGEARWLRIPGDRGEFELYPLHVPIISMLGEGEILVDGRDRFQVEKGMVKCLDDRVVILVEETSLRDVDTAATRGEGDADAAEV